VTLVLTDTPVNTSTRSTRIQHPHRLSLKAIKIELALGAGCATTKLGVALRTIKTHRARVMQKIDVVSVAELVRLAQKPGVAPAPLRPKGP
jgi:FixJ family two-component response regulator